MKKDEVERELAKHGYVKTVSVPRNVIDMHDRGFDHRVILWRDDWEKLTPESIESKYKPVPKEKKGLVAYERIIDGKRVWEVREGNSVFYDPSLHRIMKYAESVGETLHTHNLEGEEFTL